MIRTAICDDDILMTGNMDKTINDIAKKNFINIETEIYFDGFGLSRDIKKGIRYDIIFLDIEMKKFDGVTAAKEIRKVDKDVLIIFVTSYEQYMKEVFDVRPFQFLTKPINLNKLEKCFLEAYEEIGRCNYYFEYKYNWMLYKLLVKDILYFKSNRKEIQIVTKNEKRKMYGKLNEIEKTLKNGKATFLRIHQSYLVNYTHIDGISYNRIILKNGETISISEDRRKSISKEYSEIALTSR